MFLLTSLLIGCFHMAMSLECPSALNLTIAYRTTCPYSLEFLINTLFPEFRDVSDVVNLELLPIIKILEGKAHCGHYDANECFLSRAHACVLQRTEVPKDILIDYISCTELKATRGEQSDDDDIQNCVEEVFQGRIPYSVVRDCMYSDESDKLLARYHHRAIDLGVKFVPYILVFEKYYEHVEEHLQNGFGEGICTMLLPKVPDTCQKYTLELNTCFYCNAGKLIYVG